MVYKNFIYMPSIMETNHVPMYPFFLPYLYILKKILEYPNIHFYTKGLYFYLLLFI